MRIEYRKKYPYFGKYKIKIHVFNRDWLFGNNTAISIEKDKQDKVHDYLISTWTHDKHFRWNGPWNVYLKDDEVFDDVYKEFPDSICSMIRPAPGYEDLEGVGKTEERVLWYDKFPYKIVVSLGRSSHEPIFWCRENIEGDYRTSSGASVTSFYFMTSFDAMAFKLAFSDKVSKTWVADKTKATKLLKQRMENTIQEYHEYMEGENVKK